MSWWSRCWWWRVTWPSFSIGNSISKTLILCVDYTNASNMCVRSYQQKKIQSQVRWAELIWHDLSKCIPLASCVWDTNHICNVCTTYFVSGIFNVAHHLFYAILICTYSPTLIPIPLSDPHLLFTRPFCPALVSHSIFIPSINSSHHNPYLPSPSRLFQPHVLSHVLTTPYPLPSHIEDRTRLAESHPGWRSKHTHSKRWSPFWWAR